MCFRSLIQAQILFLNTQEIFRCPAQFVCSNKSKHFCKREDVTHENRVYTLLCAQYWSAGKHVHYLELHIQIARQKVPEEMETELWFEPTRAWWRWAVAPEILYTQSAATARRRSLVLLLFNFGFAGAARGEQDKISICSAGNGWKCDLSSHQRPKLSPARHIISKLKMNENKYKRSYFSQESACCVLFHRPPGWKISSSQEWGNECTRGVLSALVRVIFEIFKVRRFWVGGIKFWYVLNWNEFLVEIEICFQININ